MEYQRFLDAYADVIVRVGLDLSRDQEFYVRAPVEVRDLVGAVVASAYRAGAKYVHVDYTDTAVARARLEHASESTLEFLPPEYTQPRLRLAEAGDATLAILGDDPEALAGVDTERLSTVRKVASRAARPALDYLAKDHHNWCVVSAPTEVWASRVYPDVPEEERLPRLIEAVAHACRLDTPDPVAAWRDHSERLMKIAACLTARAFDRFHYEAPGTDFTVGMPANQYWVGTEGHASKGNRFIANIPTDETFSAPDWRRAEGTIRSTRPAIISGNNVGIVDLVVRDGKIVEARAERHIKVLESELDLDDRARYFGEIALVAESSPVAQTKTVFFDGLYDENAGCHLAFGNAYPNCVRGGAEMETDALIGAGLNQSDQHFDFTIGSDQLSITAYTVEGDAFPVMRHGEWSSELLAEAGVAPA